jgi:hypothetical protein
MEVPASPIQGYLICSAGEIRIVKLDVIVLPEADRANAERAWRRFIERAKIAAWTNEFLTHGQHPRATPK